MAPRKAKPPAKKSRAAPKPRAPPKPKVAPIPKIPPVPKAPSRGRAAAKPKEPPEPRAPSRLRAPPTTRAASKPKAPPRSRAVSKPKELPKPRALPRGRAASTPRTAPTPRAPPTPRAARTPRTPPTPRAARTPRSTSTRTASKPRPPPGSRPVTRSLSRRNAAAAKESEEIEELLNKEIEEVLNKEIEVVLPYFGEVVEEAMGFNVPEEEQIDRDDQESIIYRGVGDETQMIQLEEEEAMEVENPEEKVQDVEMDVPIRGKKEYVFQDDVEVLEHDLEFPQGKVKYTEDVEIVKEIHKPEEKQDEVMIVGEESHIQIIEEKIVRKMILKIKKEPTTRTICAEEITIGDSDDEDKDVGVTEEKMEEVPEVGMEVEVETIEEIEEESESDQSLDTPSREPRRIPIKVVYRGISFLIPPLFLPNSIQGALLNDKTIELFMNQFMVNERYTTDKRKRFSVMNSFFYPHLRRRFTEFGIGVQRSELPELYNKVFRKSLDKNLLKKDILVFPIFIEKPKHWLLALVHNAKGAIRKFPERLKVEERTDREAVKAFEDKYDAMLDVPECRIIFMDSLYPWKKYREQLGLRHNCIANTLRLFLQMTAAAHGEELMSGRVRHISCETLPKQMNAVDCGIYMMAYAEYFTIYNTEWMEYPTESLAYLKMEPDTDEFLSSPKARLHLDATFESIMNGEYPRGKADPSTPKKKENDESALSRNVLLNFC